MAVRVRLFAALREAAGSEWIDVEATTAATLVAELTDRFGEPMTSRLRVATLLVDGDTVPKDDVAVDLARAEEVVLLPPFAGGCERVVRDIGCFVRGRVHDPRP